MKKRHIFNTLLCTFSVLFLFVGCSLKSDNEPTDVVTTTISETSQVQSTTESTTNEKSETDDDETSELKYLRFQIKENDALVGVAYLDFLPDTSNVSKYSLAVDRISSAMFDKYPFLERCAIAFNEGNVAFAVVPASKNATVTIYRSSIDDEGMYKDEIDKPLFKSEDGEAIVFLCNDNENYSNVLISVKDGNEVVEFRPMISLENGRDVVLSEGCYDFTYYDMRGYLNEADIYLSKYVDEIRKAIGNGMSLCFDSEEFMYNHYALKYKLGTYDDDGSFVCKKEYLIDEYYTSSRKFGQSSWKIICGGLDLSKVTN